jgi:acyl carrier protein
MPIGIEEIEKLVGLLLGRRNVTSRDRLVEDLNAESSDLVNIVATLEEKYEITIAEEEIPALRTVADLHALVTQRLTNR